MNMIQVAAMGGRYPGGGSRRTVKLDHVTPDSVYEFKSKDGTGRTVLTGQLLSRAIAPGGQVTEFAILGIDPSSRRQATANQLSPAIFEPSSSTGGTDVPSSPDGPTPMDTMGGGFLSYRDPQVKSFASGSILLRAPPGLGGSPRAATSLGNATHVFTGLGGDPISEFSGLRAWSPRVLGDVLLASPSCAGDTPGEVGGPSNQSLGAAKDPLVMVPHGMGGYPDKGATPSVPVLEMHQALLAATPGHCTFGAPSVAPGGQALQFNRGGGASDSAFAPTQDPTMSPTLGGGILYFEAAYEGPLVASPPSAGSGSAPQAVDSPPLPQPCTGGGDLGAPTDPRLRRNAPAQGQERLPAPPASGGGPIAMGKDQLPPPPPPAGGNASSESGYDQSDTESASGMSVQLIFPSQEEEVREACRRFAARPVTRMVPLPYARHDATLRRSLTHAARDGYWAKCSDETSAITTETLCVFAGTVFINNRPFAALGVCPLVEAIKPGDATMAAFAARLQESEELALKLAAVSPQCGGEAWHQEYVQMMDRYAFPPTECVIGLLFTPTGTGKYQLQLLCKHIGVEAAINNSAVLTATPEIVANPLWRANLYHCLRDNAIARGIVRLRLERNADVLLPQGCADALRAALPPEEDCSPWERSVRLSRPMGEMLYYYHDCGRDPAECVLQECPDS